MSAISNESKETIVIPEEPEKISASAARRRRTILVNTLRILLLVVFLGSWELGTRIGFIDPFFWGQPSGILQQIITWIMNGTAQGPLWQQILVTLEEAIIGFVIGVVLGIIFGVVLGRNRFLADVLGPYVKTANAI